MDLRRKEKDLENKSKRRRTEIKKSGVLAEESPDTKPRKPNKCRLLEFFSTALLSPSFPPPFQYVPTFNHLYKCNALSFVFVVRLRKALEWTDTLI